VRSSKSKLSDFLHFARKTSEIEKKLLLCERGVSENAEDGGCPPFWIFEIEILTAMQFTDMLCIVVPNFMEIVHTVAEISQFLTFF